MGGAIKWLISMAAALAGSAIGDILYAQRGEHPQGDVVVALRPEQALPCVIAIALVGRVTRGNLLAMVAGGLLEGVATSLGFGARMQGEMIVKKGKK